MNLASSLYQISKSMGDKISIIEDEKEISYKELWERIDKLGDAFLKLGIKEGDKVAIILANCKEFIFVFFAILKINAIAIPIEPVFTTYEYKEMFDESSPCAIITSSYIITKVLGYEKSLLESRKLIIVDIDPWIKEKYPDSLDFEDLYKMGESSKNPQIPCKDNQIASINYTYRGYGYPVGAVLSHENYFYCVNGWSETISDNRIFLLILPMAHVFALISAVIAPLLQGSAVIIMRSYAAREIFKAIDKYKVDYMIGVPTLYLYLMKVYDKSKYDISSLKYSISGGSFLPHKIHSLIEHKMGIKIFQGYGLTEGLIVSCNPKLKNKPGSLGLPGNGIKVKIVTENGKEERRIGAKGEIVISGPTVMRGFYKREKETKDVLRDGWLYTGDYGSLDEDGYLYFEGLKKNIAKVGGHSVDLKEIEKVLVSHPCISNVKVYTKKDELWGEIITAEIFLGKKISEDKINKFCSDRLGVYKMPKEIILNEITLKEKERILIVDDDIECLELYVHILEKEEYRISKVTTGSEAFEEIRKWSFDLILLDLVLPDIDGIRMIKEIRKINEKITIVIITGHPSLISSIDLLRDGVYDYLTKPVSRDKLKQIVKEALEKNKTDKLL